MDFYSDLDSLPPNPTTPAPPQRPPTSQPRIQIQEDDGIRAQRRNAEPQFSFDISKYEASERPALYLGAVLCGELKKLKDTVHSLGATNQGLVRARELIKRFADDMETILLGVSPIAEDDYEAQFLNALERHVGAEFERMAAPFKKYSPDFIK